MPPTPNKIWENKGQQNTANFGQNKFFCKNRTTAYLTTTPSKSFYVIT